MSSDLFLLCPRYRFSESVIPPAPAAARPAPGPPRPGYGFNLYLTNNKVAVVYQTHTPHPAREDGGRWTVNAHGGHAHAHRSHQATMAHGHRGRLALDGILEHRRQLLVALAC